MSEHEAIVVVLPALFIAVGFVVWAVATNIRRARVARTMVEMQSKMLDKMSAADIMAYSNSDAGRAMLNLGAGEGSTPHNRILNAVTVGVILCCVGVSLPNVGSEAGRAAGPVIGVGAGFLISAAVSFFLCRKWGLLEAKK